MPNVIFRDKLVYSFNRSAFSLQYFDSGDLHGNDNFRTQDVSAPIYEILNQIDPDILHSALAATINNKPVPLTAKITEDCTLDIITIDAPDGKTIYYRSLAFFLAQAVFLLDPSTRLTVFDLQLTTVLCNLISATMLCFLTMPSENSWSSCFLTKLPFK